MSLRHGIPLGFSIIALAIASPALADEVVLVPNSTFKLPGGRVRGQITAESPSEVKIKPTTGAEQAVPLDQIAGITYEGAPPSLALAETRENAGNLTEAADLFKKAVGEAAAKPLAAQAAAFGRARVLADLALASPNKVDAALAELEDFLKKYAKGRHLAPALESLIRLSLVKGDTARAESALAQLIEAVPSAADRAAVLKARVLARKGKSDQAVAALDEIIATAPKGSAKSRDAKLAKAESLLAGRKFDEAQATVLEVIQESPPENVEVQALAHNTLGDCYRAAGRPKDALMAYLKTDILFDKDKEQHPRAIAKIAEIFLELKQDGRAAEQTERLRSLYPQSPYASGKTVAK